MLNKSLLLTFGLLVIGHVSNAQASTIDFTDGAGHDLSSFTKTVDGVTATFSNSITDSPSDVDDFAVFSSGLLAGTGFTSRSFDVSFDQAVQLDAFTLGLASGTGLMVDITGPGVNATNIPTDTDGVFNVALQANQTYNFLAFNSGLAAAFAFSTWDFSQIAPAAVPEPATVLLLGTGLVGLVGYGHRRRKAV